MTTFELFRELKNEELRYFKLQCTIQFFFIKNGFEFEKLLICTINIFDTFCILRIGQ